MRCIPYVHCVGLANLFCDPPRPAIHARIGSIRRLQSIEAPRPVGSTSRVASLLLSARRARDGRSRATRSGCAVLDSGGLFKQSSMLPLPWKTEHVRARSAEEVKHGRPCQRVCRPTWSCSSQTMCHFSRLCCCGKINWGMHQRRLVSAVRAGYHFRPMSNLLHSTQRLLYNPQPDRTPLYTQRFALALLQLSISEDAVG